MRIPARTLLFLAATALFAAAPPPAPVKQAAAKAAARSARTRERIDALFKHRLKPDPLPVVLPNPFNVVGGGATRTDDPEDGVERTPSPEPLKAGDAGPVGTDAEVLARYAATLRIAGTLKSNDKLQLIINQAPRKEGDYLFIDTKDAVIYFRIIRIAPGELTLGYNEAVQTIRFKN